MSVDAIGGANSADLLGLLSQGISQQSPSQAASLDVLKVSLNEANSNGEALAAEISNVSNSGSRLNVYG